MSLQPGTRIDDRYELLEELGRGGAAQVHRARDLSLDRVVAVKLLTGGGQVADPARFEEEARILASLRHPHILQVFGSGAFRGTPFLVLELVEGGSLHGRVFQGEIPEEDQLRYAREVASALAAAHSRGVLHRDVKPENVLLTAEGATKLSDFGLAKSAVSQVRTRTGWILGTPEYLAPEVLRGEAASPASDVYAWGCLAFLLANRSPPVTGGIQEILRAHSSGVYRRGKERGGLAAAIRRALDPDPERRPEAGALPDVLASEGETSSRTRVLDAVALGGRPGEPRRRPSAPLLAAGAAALAAVALGALALRGEVAPESSPAEPTAPAPPPRRREWIQEWAARGETLDAPRVIEDLHGRSFVKPRAATYIDRMADHRHAPHPEVDPTPLRAEAGSLPYRETFEEARSTFLEIARHPRRAPAEKAALLRALRPFLYLDQYYASLGLAEPYGAREVLRATFPYVFVPGPEPRPASGPVLPEDEDPGPGRHLLREWTEEHDRDFPWLAAQGGEAHAKELQWILFAKMSTGNAWELREHEFLRGRLHLDAEPERRYREARLRVELGNFFMPQLLRVEMNSLEIEIPRDPPGLPHRRWRHRAVGEEVLEVRFPSDVLRAGLNAVRITVRPLPGLLRYQGIEADRMWIELVER